MARHKISLLKKLLNMLRSIYHLLLDGRR